MQHTLILTPHAQQDLDDAYNWYEEQNQGLGKEYIRCIDAKMASIQRNPLQYQVVFREQVRRALVNRFPFSIYFVMDSDMITVMAILHQRRSPQSWKSRIQGPAA